MTLQDLLKPLGIKNAKHLAEKTGLSKQAAHALWTGKYLPGRKSAISISDATAIPLGLLLGLGQDGDR